MTMKMEIARELIKKNCVKFSPSIPFNYASGLKGPIYCDNRLVLGHVAFRDQIVDEFIQLIKKYGCEYDLVGGLATAGIPHAAFIADRLKDPMIYIRPKPKDHGKKNQIEGEYREGQSVLLIEDLVNQGSSLVDAMKAIVNAGLVSSQCLCIVDYQMAEAKKRLQDFSLTLYSLTDFDHLLLAALELQLINISEKNILLNWHNDPIEWSSDFLKFFRGQ